MSLLQDVLRTQTLDSLDRQLGAAAIHDRDDDSDDELVNVVSAPGTPASRSRPSSRPGSPSPSPGMSALRAQRIHSRLAQGPSRDPLKALPTEVSQRVFAALSVKDLARCSRVSKKWCRSQTLNYVWFQLYRKDNFHDDSLPPGKWTKRESKQNWRTTYLQSLATRSPTLGPLNPSSGSGYSSPASGYHTPREQREEQWRAESDSAARPSKVEMREMYKELGGRKARAKGKVGSAGGGAVRRDRGGWEEEPAW